MTTESGQHILIFISSLGAGGAERVTANLANYWINNGWQVTVVTLSDGTNDFYKMAPSVQRYRLGLLNDRDTVFIGIFNNLRRIFALRRILRQTKPAIAVAMMDKANILLAIAAMGLKNLILVGSEHTYPPRAPMGYVWESIRTYLYGQLQAVIALTVESANWLRLHTRARRVYVIPNAVPWPFPNHSPNIPLNSSANTRHILLAVGRLSEEKGFHLLISAFQRLAANFPQWQLVILGEGPERQALVAQIASTGLSDCIHLPGRAGNVGHWYEVADLYVMSSRFEGFGNTLAEAMAYGVPTVSFDCDVGPRNIIRHEVDGLLVPADDVVALSAALSRLMDDSNLRKQFGDKAREARERFSIAKIGGMWDAAFYELRGASK